MSDSSPFHWSPPVSATLFHPCIMRALCLIHQTVSTTLCSYSSLLYVGVWQRQWKVAGCSKRSVSSTTTATRQLSLSLSQLPASTDRDSLIPTHLAYNRNDAVCILIAVVNIRAHYIAMTGPPEINNLPAYHRPTPIARPTAACRRLLANWPTNVTDAYL